jgi:DNA modification methylase
VIVVDLPPEQAKALCTRLNVLDGAWDLHKLAILMDELCHIPEFDTTLTGFSMPDIQALVAEHLHASLEGKEVQFDVDADLAREGPAITTPGELVALGRHLILCGDSSNPRSFQILLQGRSANCLFTDPPFNVDYYGGNRPTPQKARPKKSRQWKRIYGDNLSQEQYEQWLSEVLTLAVGCLLPGSALYIWNGHKQFGAMYSILKALAVHVSCVITWAKETFAIGYGDYNQQTEFCLYGWREIEGAGAHSWHGPTNESTLWEVKRDPTKTYVHPTQKPLELAERAIRNSTRPGDIVLDAFMGSGTTLIGCERTGRVAVGIELDPHYVDCICRRYIAFVGESNVPPELAYKYRSQPLDSIGASNEVAL